MRLPSNSPLTPGYGFGSTLPPYSPSSPHQGVDFQHVPDDVIYAPFSGKVIHGYNDRDGNGTYMYSPSGDFHGMLHASKYLVGDGAQVSEGQPIAVMGETGLAQGVHLHWCVKRGNAFIDPMSLITNKGANMIDTPEKVSLAYQLVLLRNPNQTELSTDLAKGWTWWDLVTDLNSRAERQKILGKVSDYDHLAATATSQINELQGKINKAKDDLK
jgi:hypothetical protein